MLPKVKEYIQKRKQIRTLDAKKNIVEEAASRLKDEIKDRELDKISEVQSQAASERSTVNEHAHDIIAPLIENVERLTLEIADVEQKIKHLKYREKIAGKTVQFDDSKAIAHRYELKPLGLLYEDEFTIIKLFIVGNDRPKNKYTLSMVGNTLLDGLIKVPYDYGCNVDYGNIRRSILSRPTVEELERYAQNLRHHEISYYADVKEQYLQTVADYTLEDFKAVLEPQHVNEFYAPLLFTIHGLGDTLDYRLYDGFYYRSGSDLQGDPFDYIKVNDILYKRYCRPEQLRITQTGNTMFGDWWSLYITKDSHGELFTRENWDKTLVDTNDYVRERNIDRRTPINFTPPRVEWKGSLPVFEDIKL